MEKFEFKKWFLIDCKTKGQFTFELYLNNYILSNTSNQYYKIFQPKRQSDRIGQLYLATEGHEIVTALSKKFSLTECGKPERTSLTRLAGFSADREWMK